MKIDKKKIDERLAGVPDSKRSHIYYAGLILEFLEQNFVPTRAWLPDLYKIVPGKLVDNKEFTAASREHRMKMSELYDLYLRWRQVKDYTSEIETKFKFSLIIRNLRLYKNGWEFEVHRVGTAQVWYVGPLAFTKDLPQTRRKIEPTTVERGTVEYDPVMPVEEVSDEELDAALDEVRFKETRNWVITEYEPDE